MMDEVDKIARANDAERLLNDRTLKQAFDELEAALVERMVSAEIMDDETRLRNAMAVGTLREVRRYLKKWVYEGKKAADQVARRAA